MSEPMDTKLRELTMRLVAMAPEAPPFPEETMVQLKPAPTIPEPTRRRSPLLAVAATAVAALVAIGVPLVLFRGDAPDPVPPATNPPEVTTTAAPPPTTTASPSVPPTTVTPTAAPEIVRIEAPVPGQFVTAPVIAVTVVAADIDAATINGTRVDDVLEAPTGEFFFSTEIALTEGSNTIEVVVSSGDLTASEALTVTYLPEAERQIAFLSGVGADEVVVDYVQWLVGDEANQAAFEDGAISSVDEGVPNDYYIRNINDQLRTLPLADEAVVILQTAAFGSVTPIGVAGDEWLALFRDDGTPWNPEVDEMPVLAEPHFDFMGAAVEGTPYWLILDAGGQVLQIEQQYIP